jgi:hypothetical protein
MRPYLIVSPGYASCCGGIRALYRLCHLLNEKGFDAYITGGYTTDEGYNKCKNLRGLSPDQLKDFQRDGIVVYPDIVQGNPLSFTTVVRWWLGITQPAPEHEIVFSYMENQRTLASAKYNLGVWHIEDYFKLPENNDRENVCFTVHKGTSVPRIPETKGAIEIAHQFPRRDLSDLFKSSQMFYSYDDLTMLSVESRLCGCPVKIVGYTNMTEESIKQNPFTNYGVSLPGKPIHQMEEELPLFKNAYDALLKKSDKEVDDFIQITQSYHMPYVENYIHNAAQYWLPENLFSRR